MREILNIGSKYGTNIDIDHLLPHRTTGSNNMSRLYEIYLPNIKNELKSINFMAITTDLWTALYKKLAYISVTVQYMCNKTIVDRIISVSHFDYDRQTADNINLKIVDILNSFDLNGSNCIFVTDRGANIVSALFDFTRLSCSAHVLNNVLSGATKKSVEFLDLCTKCKQ